MRSCAFRILIATCVVIVFLSLGMTVYAVNVSPALHPNLAAAQRFVEKAINKISAAQRVNEFDMNSHAAKAKALLDQAYAEIKLAAEAANAHK
jgi:hypothetical protein